MGKVSKGKEIVEEPEVSDSSPNASGSEEDLPQPPRKKTKKASKGKAPKGTKRKERSKDQAPKKPSAAQIMRKTSKLTFEQTRWVDTQVLQDLGILDGVRSIFENMGLLGLFNMSEVAHKEETYQFLASMTFFDDTSLAIDDENRGRVDFKIHGKEHSITLEQIRMLYHFPSGGEVYSISLDDPVEAQGVWNLIAHGTYTKGTSKATLIRHPAFRYVHKVLANTLFGRRETGGVKEEELALIIEGIKPYLGTLANGDQIIGLPQPIHYAHYLVRRFQHYQDWIMTNRDATPKLNIGGLITPILRACQVEIKEPKVPPSLEFIDAPYLAHAKFLAGRQRTSYAYKFKLGGEYKIIILPNLHVTHLNDRRNCLFTPKVFYLYDSTKHGKLQTVTSRRFPQQGEDEEAAPIYGSKRYDFKPYEDAIAGTALRTAHEHIGLLQRFIKWQNKNLKKLTKKIKEQGKAIKSLKKMVSGSSRREGEDLDHQLALTLAREEEQRAEGQGEGVAPLSPSSSGSGNYCYPMDDSSSSPSQVF